MLLLKGKRGNIKRLRGGGGGGEAGKNKFSKFAPSSKLLGLLIGILLNLGDFQPSKLIAGKRSKK